MPRNRSNTVQGSPAGAAETAIAILAGLDIGLGNPVDLEGTVDVTIGANGTAVTLKLERGSAAGGVIVATYGPFTAVAANRYNFTINGVDTQAAELQNQSYTMTITVTAATAQSTVNAVYLGALY